MLAMQEDKGNKDDDNDDDGAPRGLTTALKLLWCVVGGGAVCQCWPCCERVKRQARWQAHCTIARVQSDLVCLSFTSLPFSRQISRHWAQQ